MLRGPISNETFIFRIVYKKLAACQKKNTIYKKIIKRILLTNQQLQTAEIATLGVIGVNVVVTIGCVCKFPFLIFCLKDDAGVRFVLEFGVSVDVNVLAQSC